MTPSPLSGVTPSVGSPLDQFTRDPADLISLIVIRDVLLTGDVGARGHAVQCQVE